MTVEPKMEKTLGPLSLWGLGVGYVISGMYFGWNLGLEQGGTLGLAVATCWVIAMYVSFTLGYAELACLYPRAGGCFIYVKNAMGPKWGMLAGLAQFFEFVFAPPAIAAAIGAYLHIFFPGISTLTLAIGTYFIFTGINCLGVRLAATFELWITVVAVIELVLFAYVALPHFQMKNLVANALPHGWAGVLPAIPFAIWFFLAIEGIANVAEETKNPQRNIILGFSSAMVTLVILCGLTFVSAIGVKGWEWIVFDAAGNPSDSPLPLALKAIMGENALFYHLLVMIGIFGLVASFHGIILAAGRATFELGREGLAPARIGRLHPRTKTPVWALLLNMCVGICALVTGKTAQIIILACFGAVTLYLLSTVALWQLRRKKPALHRPFRTPFFPYTAIVALITSSTSLCCLVYYYPNLALIYGGLLCAGGLGMGYMGSHSRIKICFDTEKT